MKPLAVLAIDQGTTGSRAICYGRNATAIASSYREFGQHYPSPGWVEHDPLEIWKSVLTVSKEALLRAKIPSPQIAAIGVTNQRETVVLWEKKTGKPVHRAIVWQDRRTAHACDLLKKRGFEQTIRSKTGLVIDPYFSGTKIAWLLEHIPGLRRRAQRGEILFGTIDTWLLWNLTGGRVHATDATNASRTLLFNIRKKDWDPQLLKIFNIPRQILPEVRDSGSNFGTTIAVGPFKAGVPIFALIGDQQAALYGQSCYAAGSVKDTYGTGCFAVLNLGNRYRRPPFGLLATLACDKQGKPVYALEGAIFMGGAAIQWLRDGLKLFSHARETEAMARSVKNSGGVTVIPAFTGLGSPHWNPHVRGTITGLTRGTTREHIVRATLEALAHQNVDMLEGMQKGAGRRLRELKVDGGATSNCFLMQFQADMLGLPVLVSDIAESTAWGAAKLAGRKSGFWNDRQMERKRRFRWFLPAMKPAKRHRLRDHWAKEVAHLLSRDADI